MGKNDMLNEHQLGNWTSVISAESISQASSQITEPCLTDDCCYWVESRPQLGGQLQIVELNAQNQTRELLPINYSAQNRVHEYGGGSYCIGVNQGIKTVYFVNKSDQQIYSMVLGSKGLGRLVSNDNDTIPIVLTNKLDSRFADLHYNRNHHSILAVEEYHQPGKVDNRIVSIDATTGAVITLVQGSDFYRSPKLNTATNELVWVCWNHPNMPWDNTALYIAELIVDDGKPKLVNNRCLLSGEQAVTQPQWSPDGTLYCITDLNNWWNIHRYQVDANGVGYFENIAPCPHDCAPTAWQFGNNHYTFIDDTHILASAIVDGYWKYLYIDVEAKSITRWISDYCKIDAIVSNQQRTISLASSATASAQLDEIIIQQQTPVFMALLSPTDTVDSDYLSRAQYITVGEGEEKTYAFFYSPTNPNYHVDGYHADGQLPPLLVMSHGGPTAMTDASLNMKIQFWTSRGFAVADVNYRGSSGFGRQYRQQLNGQWGLYDVDDCCNVVDYLADNHYIDRNKVVIRGSSAGGYTTLCALTFTDYFAAGCSLYGIGDLKTLAEDTHKFELRYLDTLIAPYNDENDEAKHIYYQRSPIHFAEQICCPVLLLQGLKDKVVPPNQAEQMAEQMLNNKIPHSLVFFENEAHGFRSAEAISKALQTEWLFYGKVLGYLDQTDIDKTIANSGVDLVVENAEYLR